MQEPYFTYLLMLFRELDVFSIPEVGTFIRVVHPAERVENEILAPREEFVYDYKEEYKLQTAQFLSERLQISLKEGKKLLEEISVYLFRYFDYESMDLYLPGIGIMHHFRHNDTFVIKSEEVRLNTFGMKDVIIDPEAGKKKGRSKSIWSWLRGSQGEKKS